MTELSFEREKLYLSRVVMWGVFHAEGMAGAMTCMGETMVFKEFERRPVGKKH